ncbi:Shikimate kinase [Pirellula staleyi DSM 6068]|uniref:Shikimate kinase n=1 Tax=Pirellula staleyi (strain ATCC 27377 / DSM 6068 / ICPB 4128) TaxID=530564 RepID=D2R260_PIRSD|nr:shikimate kinase [Pirellula staleyi]ADB18671.1 Shikimate kinase [Pirellula staleyi DSM 6068]
MHLYLIGYRGSGKTTVAQHLSKLLGWPAIDADVVLEEREKRTIKQIFEAGGEPLFRDLETSVLEELAARSLPPQIVALGGGVILREKNRRLIRHSGAAVWLKARATTLWQRISTDPTTGDRRPNLTASGGLEEVYRLLEIREPLYRIASRWSVDADAKAPARIATQIYRRLGSLRREALVRRSTC